MFHKVVSVNVDLFFFRLAYLTRPYIDLTETSRGCSLMEEGPRFQSEVDPMDIPQDDVLHTPRVVP